MTGALALLILGMTAPVAASGADPEAPFRLPRLYTPQPWSEIFSGPGGVDYLRSGGVNCAKPAPLTASNAGSGHGYRVPFTMALTDGRAIAGYSPQALEAGQFPFGGGAYGITGWVRGWVELPSLQVTVPPNGTTLCPGSGVYWAANPDDPFDPHQGVFAGVAASTDAPQNTSNYAWTELVPIGTPQTVMTGLTSSGALQFEVSMPVEVHAMQNRQDGQGINDCTVTMDLTLGTAPVELPKSFSKIDGALPADPALWARQSYYDTYYRNPFDMKSTPPDRYYMPPHALPGAVAGQTATVANGTLSVPRFSAPIPPRAGRCDNQPDSMFAQVSQAILAPLSLEGSPQPARPLLPLCPGCQPILTPWSNFINGVMPLFEIPSGSVQTSVDITIADIGLPKGLPGGFGFS